MRVEELLKLTLEKKASDLHIKVGNSPILRVDGRLAPIKSHPQVTQEDAIALAFSIMNHQQKERFKERLELDLAYSSPGLGRFRVSIFQQRGTVGLVFRSLPTRILTMEELNLPPAVEKLAAERRGLILVTGTTGSGKSTTLTSMIDHINRNYSCNIITIEDPIEFLHRDRKSIISQREVGYDTESFGAALRSALRQDPDVILVGEMRDYETISTALVAAETGHLVMSTLHTLDAVETVNRIISVYPPYQQQQVRLHLAAVLRGIVSMRLVPRAEGVGRVPAIEVLVATQSISECVIDPDKTRRIPELIAAGHSQYGMQTFDQSLYGLYEKRLVSYEEALQWSTNPDDFALRVKGIESTSEVAASWQVEKPEESQGGFTVERFGR